MYREFDKWDRRIEVVDQERYENAEASRARDEIFEEDVPVVDPNSVLQINFDEEDPKEDPEEDAEEDLGEDFKEGTEEGL